VVRLAAFAAAVALAFIPLVAHMARVSTRGRPLGPSLWTAVWMSSLLFVVSTLLPLVGLYPCERWLRTTDLELRRARLRGAILTFRIAPWGIAAAEGFVWALYVTLLQRLFLEGRLSFPSELTLTELMELATRTLCTITLLPLLDWLLTPLSLELGTASRKEGHPPGKLGLGLTPLLFIYTTAMVLSPLLTVISFHLQRQLDLPHLLAYLPAFALWVILSTFGQSWVITSPIRGALRQVQKVIGSDGTIGTARLHPIPTVELDEWSFAINQVLDQLAFTQRELHVRLTERDRLVQQAQDALKLRDEFIDIAAHELRTPLTALLLQLERARTQSLLPADDRPLRHARRLASLVDALLDVSRIQAGRLAMVKKPVLIGELIKDVLGDEPSVVTGPLRFNLAEGLELDLDADRMEQVLINLVSNARKYGPANGVVEVSTRLEGTDVLLSVDDDGPGVPEGDRERIFERFFRSEEAARSLQAGMGLGLYVCRTIVEHHGGRIWVEEGSGGRGAVFHIRLPGARVRAKLTA
jgi:signal transduction histidine kinase